MATSKNALKFNLKDHRRIPHPSKAVFQRHGIALYAVCEAVGKSYSYISNILCGNQPAPPDLDAKLRELAASLEEEAA